MILEHIIVADWSKAIPKRVVYHLNVPQRCIKCLNPPPNGWSVQLIADTASQFGGRTLILFDVAIGFPRSLFNMIRTAVEPIRLANFSDFLRSELSDMYLGESQSHNDWGIHCPYIHVPSGNGALTLFTQRAQRMGVLLYREIDLKTKARSPLILSGIPGTVGSGSRDVLKGLRCLKRHDVSIWPFDGGLDLLLARDHLVIGEIYPRALYGHVLLDVSVNERCLIALGKTRDHIRDAAVAQLEGQQWHRELGVSLDQDLLQRARKDEDDFDAYFSSLGILRLLLENVPLEASPLIDRVAEGGMLGVMAAQVELGQKAFVAKSSTSKDTEIDSAVGARHLPNSSDTPWVRVTSKVIEQVAKNRNHCQISFSGLPQGSKEKPTWVEIGCKGNTFTLTVKDTTACWRTHQVSTIDDFDLLYDLLLESPGQQVPVALVDFEICSD